MGFLDRLRGRRATPQRSPTFLGGSETLDVVGESFYQPHLWNVVGGYSGSRVRCPIDAVLVPEPENPHDSNAVRVEIAGGLVGHLAREDAAAYQPGVFALMQRLGGPIGLRGHVVGGGRYEGRAGMLGVFLDHEPSDFGVVVAQFVRVGALRTGLSQAIATDLDDDTYDLSWLNRLSGRRIGADVATLRTLVVDERDPIDRHFMFAELSKCLYANRERLASALDEFDAVCEQHHAEMDVIRPALLGKFGQVPIVEMYRQAAIRCQKARDWERVRRWAERGLAVHRCPACRSGEQRVRSQ